MSESKIFAAILSRVSTSDQDYQSQIDEIKSIIFQDDKNIVVLDENIYAEKISGMVDSRLSLERLKKDVKNGKINRVYCSEYTRLSRKANTLVNEYEYFVRNNVPIYFVQEDLWTQDPDTLEIDFRTKERIYGAATWGESELAKIRNRTMRGRLSKATKGLYVGHLAFGYKVELSQNGNEKLIVKDEDEARIVEEIFHKIANESFTTVQITKWLNNQQIKTKWSKWAERNPTKKDFYLTNSGIARKKSSILWTYATVKQLIKCRWYIGERTYKNLTLKCPQIVTEELFNLANARLKVNKKADNARKVDNVYCLSNIFFCGKCNMSMNSHTNHISSTYYCSSKESGQKCNDIGISKDNIEMALLKVITYLSQGISQDPYFRDYFKISLGNYTQIIENILQLETEIETLNKQISSIENQIAKLLIHKSETQIPSVEVQLTNQIKILSNQREDNRRTIISNNSTIELLKSQKDSLDNTDNIISKINDKRDLFQVREIFHGLIDKCILYNISKYFALIQVHFKSSRVLNVIYQRRKNNLYNTDLLFNLKRFPAMANYMFGSSKLEIEAINTPQQVYFIDNSVIEYEPVKNTFILQKELFYSSPSTCVIADHQIDSVTGSDGFDEALNYIESLHSDLGIKRFKGEISLKELCELLINMHSISYTPFVEKGSDLYKLRSEKSQYYSRLRKAKLNVQSEKPHRKSVIDDKKQHQHDVKLIYQERYRIKKNPNISESEKVFRLERLLNDLNELKRKNHE